MRYFISLSFKGTSFCGWQHQVNCLSVQDEIERALNILFGKRVEVTGAGRTDAGVHAINYVAHFDLLCPIPPEDFPRVIYKLNAILCPDVVIHNIHAVDPGAHARFDAVSRTYRYYIHTLKDPFLKQYSYYFPYNPDIGKMNEASKYLLGEHDFTSMAKLHSNAKTNICTVKEAFWSPGVPVNISPSSGLTPLMSGLTPPAPSASMSSAISGSHPDYSFTSSAFASASSSASTPFYNAVCNTFCFTITANRFLRNMVRAVVGSLLEVGRGKHDPEWIAEILRQKSRSAAGSSVPAHPLILTSIEYPSGEF
jgi:tRNA pseudouridine38-40 synthase